jgi:FkbM family methyltransferase
MALPAALARISVLERLSRNAAQLANVVLDDGLSFTRFDATVCGFPLRLVESAGSITSAIVVEELNKGSYPLADIAALVKPGSILLDLGTNVGITAIVLAKLYPHARVVGVEPAPPNFAAAVANVRENGVADRVLIVNAALATAGDLTMHFSVQNPGASSLSKEFFDLGAMQDLGSRTYTVASVSLDELLDFAGVGVGDIVPFVKLDCEGCEYDIVPAASARAKALLRSAVVAGETHADRMPSVPAATVTDTHSYYSMYSAVGSTPAKLWQPPPDLAAANAALGKTRTAPL